jgi:hypothetical protein
MGNRDHIDETRREARSQPSRKAVIARRLALVAVLVVAASSAFAATAALSHQSTGGITPAKDQYGCNSGRGNGSETNSSQLVDPHNGGSGPGTVPTVDCDPGNSGSHNRGGD